MREDHLETALEEGRTTMTEPESKRLLAEYGIEVPEFEVVSSADAATDAAERIGTPVVVKVVSPEVVHKSEWANGLGVQTGVDTPEEGAVAAQSIVESADERGVDVSVLVEASADLSNGTEIIVGGSRNQSFGPSVLVGLGGVFTEIYEDTAHRLAPLSVPTAHDAIGELQAAPLLDGYRNRPPADREGLANAIVTVGDLLNDNSEIAEVDVNPIYASPDRSLALDAHIVLED
jgi:succinyl-CoA synthetase beta subunit